MRKSEFDLDLYRATLEIDRSVNASGDPSIWAHAFRAARKHGIFPSIEQPMVPQDHPILAAIVRIRNFSTQSAPLSAFDVVHIQHHIDKAWEYYEDQTRGV